MSDVPDPAPDRDARAGEYVLGLGDVSERRAFEREMANDAALGRAVAGWERRLGPLLVGFRPVPPPRELWERVSRNAFGEHGIATAPARPSARSRLAAGAVGFALAAGIAVAVLLGRPLLSPGTPVMPIAALVPATAGAPVLAVWRDADGGLLVRSIGAVAAPSGKDYELWFLRDEAKRPVALGILRDGKAVVAADRVPEGSGRILASLEARGGSPTDLPQGPVLWSGALHQPGRADGHGRGAVCQTVGDTGSKTCPDT